MNNNEILTEKNEQVDVATRSLLDRDLFDVSLLGTGIRCSLVLYILAAITLLSFFILPFTSNTVTTRSQTNNEIGNYKSSISDMLWNDAPSTGFDVAMGRTVHYTRVEKKDTSIYLPLTNGVITGKNTKDMNLYISYGNLLIAIVPILAIYVAILTASRSQWQKGKGFLVIAIISFLALAFNFIVIGSISSGYSTHKPASEMITKRFADILSNLGAGFYVTAICLILIIIVSVYAFIALKNDKGFISNKNKKLYAAATAK